MILFEAAQLMRLQQERAVATREKRAEQKIRIAMAPSTTARVRALIFVAPNPARLALPFRREGRGRADEVPPKSWWFVVCSSCEPRAS